MDRIWQWAWDRYGPRYSWAMCAIVFALMLPTYFLWPLIVVAFERSDRYVEVSVQVFGLDQETDARVDLTS